jgi:hypothetical protein
MSTFVLNCLLLNDDPKRQVFTVKVPGSENVSILKELRIRFSIVGTIV